MRVYLPVAWRCDRDEHFSRVGVGLAREPSRHLGRKTHDTPFGKRVEGEGDREIGVQCPFD